MQATVEQSPSPFNTRANGTKTRRRGCFGSYIPVEHLSRLRATCSSAWYPTFSSRSTWSFCSLPIYVQQRRWETPSCPLGQRHIPINLLSLFKIRRVIHPDLPFRCFRVLSTPNPVLGGPTNPLTLSYPRPRLHLELLFPWRFAC